MKKLMMVLLSVMMILTLAACGGSNTDTNTTGNETNEEQEVLKVGTEANYAPFNWTQSDDLNGAVAIEGSSDFANGYDIQIAKRVAEGLNKKLVVVKVDWDGLIPALTSGKIDMILAGMSPTAKRAETIDFSSPYYESDLVMVVKADGPYANATSKADFNGAKVVAQLGTFHDTVIDQIEGVDHLAPMESFPVIRVAVQSGKADAYIAEKPEGEAVKAANIGLKMIELTDGFEASVEDTQVSVGLRKDSEYKEEVNKVIEGITEEQRIQIMTEVQSYQ